MRGSSKVVGVFLILLILGGVVFAVYSSYKSLQFSITGVSIKNIELKPGWETIFYAITGNLLLAALSTVYAIDLDLAVRVSNPSFLPVIIPSFDYRLYGNNVYIGSGRYPERVMVEPSSSRTIHITQKITVSAMPSLLTSIINNQGMLDVKVDGEAHLSPLPISIPFQSTRSINVYQEVRNKIESFLTGKKPTSTQVNTILILDPPPSSIAKGQLVVFTGRLIRADANTGVSGVTIKIFDDDLIFDDLMASGTTKSDGTFRIEWTSKPMDPLNCTVEVYAKFEGNSNFVSSESIHHSIRIS